MKIAESFRLAIIALTANKLRAFLTMLGIIIGVAAVITLVSVGRSVQETIVGEFQGLGHNLLFVFPGDIQPGQGGPLRSGGGGLTYDDYTALADPFSVPDVIRVVPRYERPAIVTRGREEARSTIAGTTAEFPDIRNFYPIMGSFFNDQDVENSARVAVIGQTVYKALFPDGEIPVGENIRINDVNFQIIGLMEEKGGTGFNDQDDTILIPISTAQRRLFPARRPDGKMRIDYIYAQLANENQQDIAIAEMTWVLRGTHNITFRDEDDFSILSQNDLVGALSQITGILTVFLAVIAGISLLVGGIGIMNIMLVSVTERTREIGLRKAVGAKQGDILWQFLTEAIVISAIGGILGLLLGAAGAWTVASFSDTLQPAVAWDSVLLAVLFSAAVGLFFGIYPARRASRLNPIDALRYE